MNDLISYKKNSSNIYLLLIVFIIYRIACTHTHTQLNYESRSTDGQTECSSLEAFNCNVPFTFAHLPAYQLFEPWKKERKEKNHIVTLTKSENCNKQSSRIMYRNIVYSLLNAQTQMRLNFILFVQTMRDFCFETAGCCLWFSKRILVRYDFFYLSDREIMRE